MFVVLVVYGRNRELIMLCAPIFIFVDKRRAIMSLFFVLFKFLCWGLDTSLLNVVNIVVI